MLTTMTLDEVLYEYYPTEGALLIDHLLTDTELSARWNEKLDTVEEESNVVVQTLAEEYLQNNGYRQSVQVILDDEEAVNAFVNDGYHRLSALRRLVRDGELAADNAVVYVESTNRNPSSPATFHTVVDTNGNDNRDALVSFDDSEYSLIDVNLSVSVQDEDQDDADDGETKTGSSALYQMKAERAVFGEEKNSLYDALCSFRLNENIWCNMETGSFNRQHMTGSFLFALDYNANVVAGKYNRRIVRELLGVLEKFALRTGNEHGVKVQLRLGDLSDVFDDIEEAS